MSWRWGQRICREYRCHALRGLVMIEIRILRRGDEKALTNVAPGVFDRAVDEFLTAEFLGDGRHHLAVATENELVVGMASAVHYVHPDKHSQLWVNEVGVAATHRGHGLGKALMSALLEVGRGLGCTEAWVLTDRANIPAMRLYSSLGGTESQKDEVMFTFQLVKERIIA
jgi:ribosomal protein S18 acetylase RimI-like enzyme